MSTADHSIPVTRDDPMLIIYMVLSIALMVAMVAALHIGYVPISTGDLLKSFVGATDARTQTIVIDIRLPRILLAAVVGASLGLAGAALQGLLRNPLAEPGVIGVSASAGLGAVIAIYFGFAAISPVIIPAFAMVGAVGATMILYILASRDPSTLTLILAGVAISSLAAALTSLAMNLSPNPFALNEIFFWLLGSVRDRSFADIGLVLPFIVPGWFLLASAGRSLDALTLGEDTAQSLGVNMEVLRGLVICGTTLAVGASVAVSGSIGFVGLVVPHLLRPFVGYQPSRLLLPSALGGALLLVLADALVRLISVGPELMLGIVTSLIGAPFFLYLVLTTRGQMR